MFAWLKKIFGTAQSRLLKKYKTVVMEVNEWDEKFQVLSDDELRAKTDEFKERYSKGEELDSLLPEAYATVKSVCRRLCGQEVHLSGYEQKWDMIPYDVQILGAIAMHHGAIAEMQTGEGKTLTATMPLYLNALSGKSVHLVTVNDYLAQRDCDWMGTIFRWLGLSVGALTNAVPLEERKGVYQKDIVYGTSSEFGFDYLRDNSMAREKDEQMQRGFFFAMVDEIDSILIDEARTPLIISGPVPVSRQLYDTLQAGVAGLVRQQKELCNRLATEARRSLEELGLFVRGEESMKIDSKEQQKLVDKAFRKFWVVSKGTPHSKILKRALENPDMREAIDNWDIYYHSEQNKQERAEALADLYIIVDEKASEYELTDKGITEWEKSSNGEGAAEDFIMMDLSEAYIEIDSDASLDTEAKLKRKTEVQEEDALRKERAHNLRQLLRAQLLMERDVDYIVQEGKVIIIDENTGRPQPGRRFSEGLHQAIEAKEQVPIQKETQTFASITLQNYFRMYKKLSGMTGTAITEAQEFKEIYKLDCLEIPTHRVCQRDDANDEIYMTEREKYNAILKEIQEVHGKGRPILIGTESVEVSEKLSRVLKQHNLPHTVLNAKYHGQEAEIIADAGRKAAITVSTNMAGRGTDIKLKSEVSDLGGLHVIGTTRHQSRRTDRQLRGRCARLGDPGTSKFFVSFEDSLLRLFASPRITTFLKKYRPPEGEPISATILTRSIETAQKRLEQRNFTIRKHTLEYDDVMNKQRQEIYSFRNEVLHSKEICKLARDVIEHLIQHQAEEFLVSKESEESWDTSGFRHWLTTNFPVTFEEGCFDDDLLDLEAIEAIAIEKVMVAFSEKLELEGKNANLNYSDRDLENEDALSQIVRSVILKKIDKLWQEHLLEMDYLRTEVRLRTVAQKDPLMEFKHEAFALFHLLSQQIRLEIAKGLFQFTVYVTDPNWMRQLEAQLVLEKERSLVEELESANEPAPQSLKPSEPVPQVPVTVGPKVGRNDQCSCGSGRKYKKCCGNDES